MADFTKSSQYYEGKGGPGGLKAPFGAMYKNLLTGEFYVQKGSNNLTTWVKENSGGSGGGSSNKKIIATLTQDEGFDPVQTEIVNTWGESIQWTRTDVGKYQGFLLNGFLPKTFALVNTNPTYPVLDNATDYYEISYPIRWAVLKRLNNTTIEVYTLEQLSAKTLASRRDGMLNDDWGWTFIAEWE